MSLFNHIGKRKFCIKWWKCCHHNEGSHTVTLLGRVINIAFWALEKYNMHSGFLLVLLVDRLTFKEGVKNNSDFLKKNNWQYSVLQQLCFRNWRRPQFMKYLQIMHKNILNHDFLVVQCQGLQTVELPEAMLVTSLFWLYYLFRRHSGNMFRTAFWRTRLLYHLFGTSKTLKSSATKES